MSLLFGKKSNGCLGVDIGTTSLRIVELSISKGVTKLENYAEVSADAFTTTIFRVLEGDTLSLSVNEIVTAISILVKKAGFKTNNIVFSIPDFFTFFTNFELPPMQESEIQDAVRFQATKYVPFPLSEMKIDWAIIEGRPSKKSFLKEEKQGTKLKILLVTVPNEIILQYQKIANLSGFKLLFLEAEVFSLVTSLIGNTNGVILLVDIGGRSTTCSVIEDGVLKSSHSFDISGNEFTNSLSKSLNIKYSEAEKLKKKIGINKNVERQELLRPLVDFILKEVKKVSKSFYKNEKKEILKIVLAGGGAAMPGLIDYFSEELNIKTILANPFANIIYPVPLGEIINEIGPSYSVAVGLALKGLKKIV